VAEAARVAAEQKAVRKAELDAAKERAFRQRMDENRRRKQAAVTHMNGRGAPVGADAFIGMAVASATATLAAFGGGEARATAPVSIHPLERPTSGLESTRNIPQKPENLIVDLSKQPLVHTPLRPSR
jgi:hypothetical protein